MIGTDGKKESEKYVLSIQHDDDDDDDDDDDQSCLLLLAYKW